MTVTHWRGQPVAIPGVAVRYQEMRGRGVAGPSYLLHDTFTDTNGTLLAAHTMEVGAGWTVHLGGATIQTNRARTQSTIGVPDLATADAAAANVVASLDVTTGQTGVTNIGGLVGRFTNTSNYWQVSVHVNASEWAIYQVAAGGFTKRASASIALAANTLYVIEATFNGTTISATLNGANAISYGSATHNQTATRYGFRTFEDGAVVNAWQFDDLEVVAA